MEGPVLLQARHESHFSRSASDQRCTGRQATDKDKADLQDHTAQLAETAHLDTDAPVEVFGGRLGTGKAASALAGRGLWGDWVA